VLTVRPIGGSFAELSSLRLRRVTGRIEDPDRWLGNRVTFAITDEDEAHDLFTDPDSPFGDSMFDEVRKALPRLIESLKDLGRFPLRYCDKPTGGQNGVGALRQLSCNYGFGPFHQYVVLRLQDLDGDWYFTEIRTVNERRLKHLIAIANSFHVKS